MFWPAGSMDPIFMSYVYLDGIQVKVREDGLVVSVTLVIALGINREGYWEILGFALGAS